ncbi:MAG: hypothetical protein AAGM29_23000, partial [Cyanobacteria bacterium J06588_4]
MPKIKLFLRFSMFKKFLTVFTAMGISLLAVNADTYKELKPNQVYATEDDHSSRLSDKQDKLAQIIAPNAQVEKVASGCHKGPSINSNHDATF